MKKKKLSKTANSYSFSLYTSDQDLNKRGYLSVYIKRKQYKFYGKLNTFKTVLKRQEYAMNDLVLMALEKLGSRNKLLCNKNRANTSVIHKILTEALQSRAVYLRPKTIQSYTSVIKSFCTFCEMENITFFDLSKKIIQDYIQHKINLYFNHSTINFHISSVQTMFQYAYGKPTPDKLGANYLTRKHNAVLKKLHYDTNKYSLYSFQMYQLLSVYNIRQSPLRPILIILYNFVVYL